MLTFHIQVSWSQSVTSNDLERPKTSDFIEILEYLTLDELNQWMDFIVEEFPDQTDLKQIGTTVNDRPIMGLHLGDKNNNSDKKKIFMGEFC